EVFLDAVRTAEPFARQGAIVTFGITPTAPNTGYGYIKVDEGDGLVRSVESFVEKPDLTSAESFLADGSYVWNAGIFLYAAHTMIEAFKVHQKALYDDVLAVIESRHTDHDFIRFDENRFELLVNISIDYAIMENAGNVVCVPISPGWNDLGSWSAIWTVTDKDENGNSSTGDTRFLDSRNCLAYADRGLLSVVGLEDVLVITTTDSVLVAHKDKAQKVKNVVEQLKVEGRDEVIRHPRAYKPWGYTERINAGDRFAVQSMMIKPGNRLGLQTHLHRAKHWIVVSGTVEITINGEVCLLTENQSAYVPLGAQHSLHNPGKLPVRMIEVQSGTYLFEDDIVPRQ
ncbi:MAG: mannose-1-phosphate guanylyltransferase/mannose-6-phosphate isomerase, partial [Roseibium sp.]|uniref:mannose-1-phosphate guanylyltransferase/mannose-6-phosphate isomerase n=2 Tax=Roseibium sp. TaxID=1936156 RepID=UPI001B1FB770